jgi:hypothetical protein
MIYQGSAMVYPTYDARDNSLLVTCYNANTWVRIPFGSSSVRQEERPEPCLLLQSYPNPFSPVTTIRFELATAAHARLDVFSVSGDVPAT